MSWATCLARTWAGRDVLSPQRKLECASVQRGPRLRHRTRRERNQAPVSLQGLNPVNLLSSNSVPGTGPYFSLPSPHTYLLELLDLGLIKHGEDIGASALCRCPSLGLLGCLKGEGWAEGFVDPSLLLWRRWIL